MDREKISKHLSWLLRHCTEPRYIDLRGGWASVEEILGALRRQAPGMSRDVLERIVQEDRKGRYSFDASGARIRANQGHSIPGVVIGMESPAPPDYLYHGTAERFLPSIMEKGLLPMSRQYVHISPDYETAVQTGRRHGKAVVLEFAAGEFVRDGHGLWRSENGIWQARHVPPRYLRMRVDYCTKRRGGGAGSGMEAGPFPALQNTYPIPCKYCMPTLREGPLRGLILGVHGFAGSKESTGLHALAHRAVQEGYGLVCFDLPGHWKSPASPDMLTVENAMADVLYMADLCRREFPGIPKFLFATSFGGYLALLCSRRGSGEREIAGDRAGEKTMSAARAGQGPYDYRILLRAPAVTMPTIFLRLIGMSAEEFRQKAPADCGTDPARPVYVSYAFYESLLRHDVFSPGGASGAAGSGLSPDGENGVPEDGGDDGSRWDYPPMLVIHGSADEVVPPADVRRFCALYPQMELRVIEGCDHGFTAPGALDAMGGIAMDYIMSQEKLPCPLS